MSGILASLNCKISKEFSVFFLFFYFISEPARSWLSQSPSQDVKYWIKSSVRPFQLAVAAIARRIQTCHCVPARPPESGGWKKVFGPAWLLSCWLQVQEVKRLSVHQEGWNMATPDSPHLTQMLKYAFISMSSPPKRIRLDNLIWIITIFFLKLWWLFNPPFRIWLVQISFLTPQWPPEHDKANGYKCILDVLLPDSCS